MEGVYFLDRSLSCLLSFTHALVLDLILYEEVEEVGHLAGHRREDEEIS